MQCCKKVGKPFSYVNLRSPFILKMSEIDFVPMVVNVAGTRTTTSIPDSTFDTLFNSIGWRERKCQRCGSVTSRQLRDYRVMSFSRGESFLKEERICHDCHDGEFVGIRRRR